MKPIILASTSKYRRKILTDCGIPFQAIAPDFDEENYKQSNLNAYELCEQLAVQKAKSLKNKFPDRIIVGSDQLVYFNSQILGKAHTPEKAIEQLLMLSGHSHELLTALSVIQGEQELSALVKTKMKMRPLTKKQAEAIVTRDQTWDCAGSYKLEKTGITLFEEIECPDHTAIIGLPVIKLCQFLSELDVAFPFITPAH